MVCLFIPLSPVVIGLIPLTTLGAMVDKDVAKKIEDYILNEYLK